MATEKEILETSGWHKLLVYWQTKNHPKAIYDIALIIAVAIYTNRKIYEEELAAARRLLVEHFEEDPDGIEEIMRYVQMHLFEYLKDRQKWYDDAKEVKGLIRRDEQLYRYCIDIFESDSRLDLEESAFEGSLRRLLLGP